MIKHNPITIILYQDDEIFMLPHLDGPSYSMKRDTDTHLFFLILDPGFESSQN